MSVYLLIPNNFSPAHNVEYRMAALWNRNPAHIHVLAIQKSGQRMHLTIL